MPVITVDGIAKALGAEYHTRNADTRLPVLSACASDLMSDVLAFCKPKSVMLTGLASPQTVRTAEMADIIAICFVFGKVPGEEAIRMAEESNISLMTTQLSHFDACGLLYNIGLSGSLEE